MEMKYYVCGHTFDSQVAQDLVGSLEMTDL